MFIYTKIAKFNILAKYGSVSHLGIQGEPGLIFYLNQGDNPITIGETGIYELNLEGIGRIHSLRFNEAMLTDIYKKEKNPFHRLIVDIVYEGAEPI